MAHYVKSNAIVYCGNGQTLGIGAGQMSRVDSARIASIKAAYAGLVLQGSVVASDAMVIGQRAGAALIVGRRNKTKATEIAQLASVMASSNIALLGASLNEY